MAMMPTAGAPEQGASRAGIRAAAAGIAAQRTASAAAAGSFAAVDLHEYQRHSRATAVYPGVGDNLTYPALGLCGEAGEVAEKVKKAIRDDGGVLTGERREALAGELGDVLWYVAQLATEAGLELDAIAEANLEKLASRRRRAVLHGSGDLR
jgi:NTP pyrophosphatase (non-canonical NTP hydrolase)